MRSIQEINAELDEIRTKANAARTAEAAVEATEAAKRRALEQLAAQRVDLIAAQRESLARDLNVGVDTVGTVLAAKIATVTGEATHIFTPLLRLERQLDQAWSDDRADPSTARDARHALGAMGSLPPVRDDDAAFATEAQVRGALPAPKFDAGGTVGDTAYLALLSALEQSLPRERAPGVESPQDARKRLGPRPITLGMALMFTGDPDERRTAQRVHAANDARKRELDLVEERYQIASAECRAEHQRAVVSQRAGIVESIDRVLAALPMGEAWWWTRQLRRIAAHERPVRIAPAGIGFDLPVAKTFHLARAAGARFDLNPSVPSTPSKKK